jgi:ribonuclease BN (tRNA processing enzyme)
MPSQLTVLGSCGAWPEPGLACAGFLLEHEGFRLALDLGYGTLPRLLAELGSLAADGLDAVIVTHHHPDHMVDLHGLMRARWFGHRKPAAIPLFAPAGVVARLVDLEDGRRTVVSKVFDWHPIPAPPQHVGPFRLASMEVPHYVPSAGVRLSAAHLTVSYTGDTGRAAALAELARDADLLIADATYQAAQVGDTCTGDPGTTATGSGTGGTAEASLPPGISPPLLNLTALDAGRVAAAARASRLLLTHFWPGSDREASRKEAAGAFGGQILLATEGTSVPIG